MAAHQLHRETVRWEEQGNELVTAAKRVAVLFAKMSRFMRYVTYHPKRDSYKKSLYVSETVSKRQFILLAAARVDEIETSEIDLNLI